MYVVTVTFEVHPEMQEAFLRRVMEQASDSLRVEPGCSRFDVSTGPERPDGVFLYEIYDDRAAFDRHLASAHFRSFDAEVVPMVVSKTVQVWQLAAPEAAGAGT